MQIIKYAKYTFLIAFSNIISKVLSAFFFIFLARFLTTEEYGLFRYYITISMILALGFSGIHTGITKYLSKKEYLSNGFYISFLIFLIISFITFNPFLTLFLFAAYVDFFYLGVVKGLLNYYKISFYKIIANLLQLILIFVFTKNFLFSVIIYCFSGLFSLIILEFFKKQIIFTKFNKKISLELIKYSLPITLANIGWITLVSINAIYIKNFYGNTEFAFYSVAGTIAILFSFIPEAINSIILPNSAKLKIKIKKPLFIFLFGNLLLSLLGLVILFFIKKPLVLFLYGEKYLTSVNLILYLGLAEIFLASHQILATSMQGLNKTNLPLITISIGALINIILSFILTKQMGIIGSSISLAIASFISFVILVIITLKYFKNKLVSAA